MNSQDAKAVAFAFNELLNVEAVAFRLPARKVEEGQDAAPTRYAVELLQEGKIFSSVLAAKQYINEG